MSDELFDPGVPTYPCVALIGSGREISYASREYKDGKLGEVGRVEGEKKQVYYVPISGRDVIEHLGHMRRFKRWAVRSYHNLEKIKSAADREFLENELSLLANPPEVAIERVRSTKARA